VHATVAPGRSLERLCDNNRIPGRAWVIRTTASAEPQFLRVPENKSVKNRVHVCLQPGDQDRDTEVGRLLALGAKISDDYRTSDGDDLLVLLDPAGNEFCVTR
jgi:hypothetical protein